MASTYSPSLRLELMATGDQSGTWGDTTNTNLGTLLEQAITGVLSVAEGDAELTLTALDGASDQSRNMVVNLTGAMTGAQNVIVPTANKLYLIKNSTTGGFAVTVKTSAGTGVAVPPLTSRWVYCDGVNVVDGLPGVAAGYTTTATAAGTTTLTSGSTYFQYFTGATTQTIVLPVASTLVAGQPFYIVNQSSGALTVNSSGGNLVATVSAGGSVQIVCILASGTSAASWSVISTSLNAYLPLVGGTMTGQLINTGSSVGYTPIQLVSTEAAAAAGPILDLYRNSASPAANDVIGQVLFNGEDSAGNVQEYGSIQAVIADPISTSEDGSLDFYAIVAGTRTKIASMGPSLASLGTPTNDSAAAGFIGEIVESSVPSSTISLTSAAPANVTSISLTAGDWDVWGTVAFAFNIATTCQGLAGAVNTTSATFPAAPGSGARADFNLTFRTGISQSFSVGQRRLSLASTTTVYLVAYAEFGVNVASAGGYIGARRVR